MANRAAVSAPATLTRRQRDILQSIRAYMDEHNHAPSMREIQDDAGISSVSVVSHHLGVLEARGYLRRTPGIPRSMVLLTPAYRVTR